MYAIAFWLLLGGPGSADLEDLGKRYDLAWTCDTATGRHTIETDGLTIVACPGFGVALVNGDPVRLSSPVDLVGGRLWLPPELARRVETEAAIKAPAGIARPKPPPAAPPPRRSSRRIPPCRIAIDPGHGGVHTGYVGHRGLMEKDLNLAVSLELARILKDWGATVLLTRQSDRHFYPQVDDDLDERCRIVNAFRPDLFLSIHGNGVANPNPRGFEIWVPKHARGARDRDSREIAKFLRAELAEVWGDNDRGTKDDRNFRVLAGTICPAALVELEFVSNPAVERALFRSDVRRRLAESVAEAVWNWVARRK